jgi:hypothetical protein
MLSYARMGLPHAAQLDAGRTTLISRGTRKITTLRKLPQTSPKKSAKARVNQTGRSSRVMEASEAA